MVDTPPSGAVQSDGFAVLTWPLHMLVGPTGPVGYVMHRIDTSNAVEIHTVSNPTNRAKPLPNAPQWTPHVTWLHLVNVAANLCLAVEVVHRVDAVIGDFQERNILVNDTTRVTLVDCDSMQFTDTAGRQFLCGVGRPEFTAPELAGLNLATAARHGLTPRARVVGMATAGVAPRIMGIGPAPATLKVLAQTGLTIDHMDVIELNEVLDVQLLAEIRGKLNELIAGLALAEVASKLSGFVAQFAPVAQTQVSLIVESLLEQVDANRQEKIILAGTANLARREEDFPGSISPVLEAIEEQVVLLKLISEMQAEQHGGHLLFEPHPPQGTIFRFTLPAAAAGESAST